MKTAESAGIAEMSGKPDNKESGTEDQPWRRKYLEQLSSLMKETTSGKFDDIKLECKHFFSGAAFYANGRICMSLTPIGFAIKLPEESRNTLMKKKGTKSLRYFPKGPIKKDYVVLPKAMLKDVKTFRRWVKISIEHVLALPEPAKKKSK